MSSDGQAVAVTLQVDTHRREPSIAAMNDLCDRMRLPREDIDKVLDEWSPDNLRRHRSSLPKAELLSRVPIRREEAGPPAAD